MSAEHYRALSRRWFEEVWNQGREATIDELLSKEVIGHGLGEGGRDIHGHAGFRSFYTLFRGAFPDLRVVVEDVLADGDKTVVRLSFTGTHKGAELGVAPTGRAFKSTALVLLKWRDGKMIEAWNEFDAAGMMAQLTAPMGMKLRA